MSLEAINTELSVQVETTTCEHRKQINNILINFCAMLYVHRGGMCSACNGTGDTIQ